MQVYSQQELPNQQRHIYTDFVKDDNGNKLQGITVKVLGGDQDVTDYTGKFSVRARIGDRITLYRDNKKIDSFIYNGSSNYQVYDTSKEMDDKFGSNTITEASSYKVVLDSAKYYVKKKPTKSIQFVEQALKSTSNRKKSAKAYEVLADAFYELKQFDLAQSNYTIAFETYSKDISLQLKLAKTYYKNSFYNKSKLLYLAVYDTKKTTPFQKIDALEGLASLSKREVKNDEAVHIYRKH